MSAPMVGEVTAWLAGENDDDDVATWLTKRARAIPYVLTDAGLAATAAPPGPS